MVICESGDPILDAAVNDWLKRDKNPVTYQEVLDDISNSRWGSLSKTMLDRQTFGTAGLRARMGAGYMCMNDVVVLQTARGICSYIQKVCNKGQILNGIVVGYDGRHNSRRFAELTAKVFVSSSIPVHLFSEVCPTPLVSFATIMYGAAVGIMVTASHNPKDDNGYKVYWSNGSQIIDPHDDNILEEIWNCLDIPAAHWEINGITNHGLVKDCLEEVTDNYMEYIRSSFSEELLEQNKAAGIRTVYSAMHGVGYKFIVKAFEAANLKPPLSVSSQQDPNPDFPTVKFPNPEEKECLKISKQLADDNGIKLILVNDPDADRLAVAEFDDESNSWREFTGNEMGALLGWWLLKQHCANSSVVGEDEVFMLASYVSSKMLRDIGKGRAQLVETLTGFKWMGNATLLLLQQGKTPIFAFEEAIGYMCSPRVPDKDGVSAAVHVATLASHLYSKRSSLLNQLQDLYDEFGYHVSYNSYFTFDEPMDVQKIFSRIRNFDSPGEYPKKLASIDILSVNDFGAGVQIPADSAYGRHLSMVGTGLDGDYRGGEMVALRCAGGLRVVVRTSGTEPKVKYYSELVRRAPRSEHEKIKEDFEIMIKAIIHELIQPTVSGLLWI